MKIFVMLKDKQDTTAIIHDRFWKCKRATRAVLGPEVYAFSHSFNFVLELFHDFSNILQNKASSVVFTDSKRLSTL